MPIGITHAVQNGKRPSPADRRQMVRITVDCMRNFHMNPTKSQCSTVAKQIVSKHPDSFADVTDEGEKLGCGYYSLLMQLKTRVEHVNRNNTVARLRKRRQSIEQREGEHATACSRPVDTYRCINWQPQDMPEGETQESLEAKREAMEEVFNQHGPSGSTENKIDDTMAVTYYLLRQNINTKAPVPSISELKQKWPFFFIPICFFTHFKCLTVIEIVTRLSEAFQSKGKRIQGYMAHQNEHVPKQVKIVLANIQSALLETEDEQRVLFPGVILLMMAYFREPVKDSLLLVMLAKLLQQACHTFLIKNLDIYEDLLRALQCGYQMVHHFFQKD